MYMFKVQEMYISSSIRVLQRVCHLNIYKNLLSLRCNRITYPLSVEGFDPQSFMQPLINEYGLSPVLDVSQKFGISLTLSLRDQMTLVSHISGEIFSRFQPRIGKIIYHGDIICDTLSNLLKQIFRLQCLG